jgi:hypothetical protein
VGPARSTLSHSSHVSGPPGSVRSGPLPPGVSVTKLFMTVIYECLC